MTLDDIRSFPYFDLVQAVRTRDDWLSQASWLPNSPQASMALYNPMVMSKLIWTRNAARMNPFNTDSFLWIDGGHLCNDPGGITRDKFQFFTGFFDKLLIS